MNKFDWSTEELDYFVSLYKKHECLWRQTNESGLNNQKKIEEAYADIHGSMFKEMHRLLTIKDIKSKFTSIKHMYNCVRTDITANHVASKNVQWYKDMDYIMGSSKSVPDLPINACNEKSLAATSTTNSTIHFNNLNSLEDREMKSSVYLKILRLSQELRLFILNSLKRFYSKRLVNTNLLMLDILSDIQTSNLAKMPYEMFEEIMKNLGFIHKEMIDGSIIVVEEAELRFQRFMYFTKIKRARALRTRQIVYIDERIINPSLKYEKVCNLDSLPEGWTIFFHAISNSGFINGLFCNQASEEDFTKWVSNILLSDLNNPSLIIMDNGPIHGTAEDECPINVYSTKDEMLDWLTNKNIPCNINMTRPILYELIKQKKRGFKEYKIDKIFKSHGHEVIRLPHAFPDLNLSKYFWNVVSEGNDIIFRVYPNMDHQTIQNKIREDIIPSISETKWMELEKKLILKESEIFFIDTAIEDILKSCKFK